MYRIIWSCILLYIVYKTIRFLFGLITESKTQEQDNHSKGKYKFYQRNSQDSQKTYTKNLGEEIEYEEIESKHRN